MISTQHSDFFVKKVSRLICSLHFVYVMNTTSLFFTLRDCPNWYFGIVRVCILVYSHCRRGTYYCIYCEGLIWYKYYIEIKNSLHVSKLINLRLHGQLSLDSEWNQVHRIHGKQLSIETEAIWQLFLPNCLQNKFFIKRY